ncbi:SAM-dependent methyltransferase [Streptomyces polygonati]|uniref:SAM-dependent methyltransferase n=1 Tax=Streptomyces polygonati TaxID=1617087 RepID=A0ABV8HTW2_9ACTN
MSSGSINVNQPSVARMYDYLLGGTDNFRADREACDELLTMAPNTRELALINRAFLKRVVRFLANAGIRQFVDHGSGLPTQDNVHQVAQRVDPASRVVYIDNDPLVFAQGRLMLETNNNTAVIAADMRNPDDVLGRPEVGRLIDLRHPVAVLFVSVLHCIPDRDDPWGLVARFADELPSGSYLVVCQLASDDAAVRDEVTDFMHETTGGAWGRVRSMEEVRRYFSSPRMRVVDELCEVSRWRPDGEVTPRMRSLEWVEFGGVAEIT